MVKQTGFDSHVTMTIFIIRESIKVKIFLRISQYFFLYKFILCPRFEPGQVLHQGRYIWSDHSKYLNCSHFDRSENIGLRGNVYNIRLFNLTFSINLDRRLKTHLFFCFCSIRDRSCFWNVGELIYLFNYLLI